MSLQKVSKENIWDLESWFFLIIIIAKEYKIVCSNKNKNLFTFSLVFDEMIHGYNTLW